MPRKTPKRGASKVKAKPANKKAAPAPAPKAHSVTSSDESAVSPSRKRPNNDVSNGPVQKKVKKTIKEQSSKKAIPAPVPKTHSVTSSDESAVSPSKKRPSTKPSDESVQKTVKKTQSPSKAHSVTSSEKSAVSPSKKRPHTDPSDEPVHKKVKETPSPTKEPASSSKEPASPSGEQLSPTAARFPSPPDQPATEADKTTWQGFCEIESDPGYFSVILREMGVEDVTVRDVLALNDEFLQDVPQPIYGLILLFRARLVNTAGQEKECPENVWFANQLPAQNSCATLAMLNTLLNCDHAIEVGEYLRQFKEFTFNMTPYNRGEALASWKFVKSIHNSFAKKMDILEDDLHLAEKVGKAEKRKKLGGSEYTRRPSDDSLNSTASLGDMAHHFIAFIPVDGELWKLDGMDAQPTNMGEVTTDDDHDDPENVDSDGPEHWLKAASRQIQGIMAVGGDPDYSIMVIAKSPLARCREEMCDNIATFKYAKKRIATLNTEWSSFLSAPAEGVDAAEPVTPTMLDSIGVFENMLAKATVPLETAEEIDDEDFPELLERCANLGIDQINLREQIFNEMMTEQDENTRARERRLDLGPLIKMWCRFLAENGYLEQNLHRFMPESPTKAAHTENENSTQSEKAKGKQPVKAKGTQAGKGKGKQPVKKGQK